MGLNAVPLALVLGLLDPMFAVVVLLASVGFGMLLSLAAVVVVEETAFHRHERLADVGRLVLAAAVEIGFRPLHAWWRVRGLLDAMSRRRLAWGDLPRIGFAG